MTVLTDKDAAQVTAMVAEAILPGVVAKRERYEQEAREYLKEGFRPERCPHGVNLWVDYDPICGWCEDGDGTPEEEAQRWAEQAVGIWQRRKAAYSGMLEAWWKLGAELDGDRPEITQGAKALLAEVGKWANEPVLKHLLSESA